MLFDPQPAPASRARRLLRWTSLPILVAAFYSGWVLYSRARENREIEEKARIQQDARKNEQERSVFEALGGNRFEILNFYTSPLVIRRGDSAQLCYGVSNAKVVRLDPPAGHVWPSLSRCIDVAPRKETTYTLTAIDASGTVLTQKVTLKVY